MTRYKDNASENNDLNELEKETEMAKLLASTSTTALAGSTVADLENLLDDLELDGLAGDEISDEIEEVVETSAADGDSATVTEEDLENVSVDDLEMSLDREDGYAEQTSDTDVAEKPAEAAAAARSQPATTPRAPRAASTPRTPRDMASLDAKVFVLEGDAASMSDDDLAVNKTAVMGTVPSQKKIAEKFENLFAALNAGKQPSVYVVQAFKLLDEKKTLSGTDITTMFKASYKQGTAQSQSGQVMTLFEATKIATRTKNTLVLNENSTVAQRLREILKAASAPATA
ncbi:hypothetical protein B7L88_gp152 [Rhizobium phage RHEph10]|uniref:hypothetical protein n=1 Tax=Rhizobium phage RHEph10 TaxID=1220717 RepID=UPI0002AB23C2|nr:hypothetical protein B7L88_gp152 [Rhizobium phage RHEph10]AGC36136.1 hypothetical protein RHEph10_gp093 [Rhizobium phage RHEph10]